MTLTEITVSRRIPAAAEEIYDVWLNPKSPGGPWFGAAKVILNGEVDGLFYWAANHQGKIWPHYGRFTRVDRPKLLEYTWMSEATKGLESLVTVTMEPAGDETEVTLRHSGVPDDDLGRQHKDGWQWMLNALGEAFEKRKKPGAQ